MLILLADWLQTLMPEWGWLRVFQYITFRAVMAAMTALLIGLAFGPWVINYLTSLKIGQPVRAYGVQAHLKKSGTPTMGGVLVLIGIAVATLLWFDWSNRFVWVVIVVTFGFGAVGWVDDYRKVVDKNPEGMRSREKFFWQSLIGLVAVGLRRLGPEWIARLQNIKKDRRLAIIESLPLDPNRRLVLVSLDGVEALEGPAPALRGGAAAVRVVVPHAQPRPAEVRVDRVDDPRNGFQRCRLASAIGADQRHGFALVDVKGDATHRLNAAIGDVESGYFKHLDKPQSHVDPSEPQPAHPR